MYRQAALVVLCVCVALTTCSLSLVFIATTPVANQVALSEKSSAQAMVVFSVLTLVVCVGMLAASFRTKTWYIRATWQISVALWLVVSTLNLAAYWSYDALVASGQIVLAPDHLQGSYPIAMGVMAALPIVVALFAACALAEGLSGSSRGGGDCYLAVLQLIGVILIGII